MNRLVKIALSAWLVLGAATAQAQTSVVIVVPHVSTTDYEHFEHQLRSELVASGFEPVSVEVPFDVTPQTLRTHAARLMSPAAISISIHDQTVSGLVWIHARTGNNDLLRPVPDYRITEQAPSVFAVRATDVLHGGLLELVYIGTRPEPLVNTSPANAGDPAATPEVGAPNVNPSSSSPPALSTKSTPLAAEQPKLQRRSDTADATVPPATKPKHEKPIRTWFIRGMANVELPFLGYPTNLGFNLSVMRRLHPNVNMGLSGALFLPAVGTIGGPGRANISQAFVGARVALLQHLSKPLTIVEFSEIGLHAVNVSGETNTPYVPRTTHSYAGYSLVGAGANWAVTGTVALIAETGLLLPWKRADVLVVRTVVAEAAGPAMLANLGIQLAF